LSPSARGPLGLKTKLLYGLGNGGAVLGDTVIATYLLFFYFPPEGSGPALAPIMLFALLPTWLIVNFVARAVDSIADPMVASWSDKSHHRLGRRRVFMLTGGVPLALCTGALFFPPFEAGHGGNAAFLLVVFCAYFFFFTVYVTPYLALVPEIGKSPAERLDLTTFQAGAALVGAAIAMVGGPLILGGGDDGGGSLRPMAALLALASLVLLMLPALFLNERRLTAGTVGEPSTLSLKDSLKATLSDRTFRLYLAGTILFWFGFNVVRGATPFYVTVLMDAPFAFQSTAFAVVFALAFLAFPLINLLARRIGKRDTLIGGVLVLLLALAAVPFITGKLSGIVVLGVASIGVGVLLSVPNAMLADICEATAQREGERREAMFFGAQGFLLKMNLGLSSGVLGLLFAWLGTSAEHPLGVQVSGPVGAVMLVLSLVAFARLPRDRPSR
jgi:glycoside/pentoside/hexuronide:cation symporter, GPH family